MSKPFSYKQTKKTVDIYEFEVNVEPTRLEEEKEKTFAILSKDVKVAGFRPGKAPKDVIEKTLGTKLFTESVNRLLPVIAYEIIVEEKLNPVTGIEYDLKEFDETKGVVFTMSFTNYPEIKLGDFSKIKVEKKKVEITDEEIMQVIKSIIRSSLPKEKWAAKTKDKDKIEDESKDKAKTKSKAKTEDGEEDFEVTDELVAELGYEEEKTLDQIKQSVKIRLEDVKSSQAEEEYLSNIVEKALELSEIELPKVFLDRELENIEHDFKSRLANLQLDPEEYLNSQGSSLEKKREEWSETAKKRIASDLVLITLATKEKLVPTDNDIQKEIDSLETPELRARYSNDNGYDYIRTVLTRQRGAHKLLEIVEGDKHVHHNH